VSATYAIDDGDGNEIAAGLSEHVARKTAQRIATERGIPVYLYETPVEAGEDGESEEFTP
jgi:glutamate formiminotransferase